MLLFWGVARFVEIQSLKMGHLVRRKDRFDLVIFSLKEDTARSSKVTPIYPTPPKYEKKPSVPLSS